ncbi:MAG: hypothetical protein JST54_13385 [Deltaproteobacteria bacterium]|nr:hypothetical protein [Deltaproteobacteria bacterium]
MSKPLRALLAGALLASGAALTSACAATSPAPPDPGHDLAPSPGPPVHRPENGPAVSSPFQTQATEKPPNAMVDQSGMRALQGTIVSANGTKVDVHAQGGAQDSFYVDQKSAILRDGESIRPSELQPGDTVRVNYDNRSGMLYATTIIATSIRASRAPEAPSP